jgi:hypothetical protein
MIPTGQVQQQQLQMVATMRAKRSAQCVGFRACGCGQKTAMRPRRPSLGSRSSVEWAKAEVKAEDWAVMLLLRLWPTLM